MNSFRTRGCILRSVRPVVTLYPWELPSSRSAILPIAPSSGIEIRTKALSERDAVAGSERTQGANGRLVHSPQLFVWWKHPSVWLFLGRPAPIEMSDVSFSWEWRGGRLRLERPRSSFHCGCCVFIHSYFPPFVRLMCRLINWFIHHCRCLSPFVCTFLNGDFVVDWIQLSHRDRFCWFRGRTVRKNFKMCWRGDFVDL